MQQACVALGVSQSGYYAWKGRRDAPRTLRRFWLAGEIADIHTAAGGTYGALRVTAELRYGCSIRAGHNAVADIMWLTDTTEHATREGKISCCVVLDSFSRRVIGWSIDSTQTTSLVLNALGMATQRRPDRDGLVLHSDAAPSSRYGPSASTSVTPGSPHRWEPSAPRLTTR